MNIVRGVADLLRKAPAPPPAPPAVPSSSFGVREGSFHGADQDVAPSPRVVFRYSITSARSLAFRPGRNVACLFVRALGLACLCRVVVSEFRMGFAVIMWRERKMCM